MRRILFHALLFFACIPIVARGEQEAKIVLALRENVQRDLLGDVEMSASVAGAYEKLFTCVGLAGLPAFVDDRDTSIALQAAWELNRKTVKRDPPIPYRTDWVFDKKLMQEFLSVLTTRLKSEPPPWWSATMLKGDVFPGKHHAFIDISGPLPPTARVEVAENHVRITAGKQSVRMQKAIADKAVDVLKNGAAPVVLCGSELSFIALPSARGYPFKVIGVDSKTGETLWVATVWASRRGFSTGPADIYPVEIQRKENTVLVYGYESHGMYVEGFDARTGKCQFRFCTSYWFNHSETWSLN